MANRPWLEAVERELVRRNLPRWRVGRMVEELRDHLQDLEDASAGDDVVEVAMQRLGRPKDLADAMWESHVAGSYLGRHPVIGFVALPIPLTILGWLLMVSGALMLFQLGEWLPWEAGHLEGKSVDVWPMALFYLAALLDFCVRILPPALAAGLYCLWAERTARGWKWNLAACLLIAVVAGLYQSSLQFPFEPGMGRWSIGLGAPGGREQLLQLMIPLAIGLWSICRTRRLPAPTGAEAMPG